MKRQHKICAYENKHYGVWKKVRAPFPYGWFFEYYELKAVDPKTDKWLSTYYDRGSKLDKFFDWICERLSR